MAEYPGKGLTALFTMVDAAIPVAVNSGIVGNAAHASGYHRSFNWIQANGADDDYSTQADEDRRGPGDACSGLDVSWPLEYMKLITGRLIKACESKDPRVYALREVIGTLDGVNVCGYNRVATGTRSRSKVGFVATGFGDRSHLWHNHFSILRRYADDIAACKAIGAVITGLPLPPVVIPKIIINGTEYDDLTSVSVAGVNLARDTGAFSRHVWYVQQWLAKLQIPGTVLAEDADGYWNADEQRAFNRFRVSLGWTGSDTVGGVGVTSLSTLALKAGSAKPVRA